MLADVVRKAADLLAQAAAKLEGNLNRFSAQAGSMTGAAQRLTASAARLPAARLGQAMAGAAAGGQQQPGAPQTAGPFATLQAQYQSSLGRLQSQVRQAQMQASYLGTPQGQQAAQMQLFARQQLLRAQEEAEQRRILAEQGNLIGSITLARNAFLSVVPAVGAALASGKMLANFFEGLASKASPSAAATYAGSWEMLQIQLGRVFVPALNGASEALQDFAEVLKGSETFRSLVDYARRAAGNFTDVRKQWGSFMGIPLGLSPVGAIEAIRRTLAGKEPEFQRPSLESPRFPWQGGVMGIEEAADAIQNMALNRDPLEKQNQQDQLAALRGIEQNITDIRQQISGLASFSPSFR